MTEPDVDPDAKYRDPDGSKWKHAFHCSYKALDDEKVAHGWLLDSFSIHTGKFAPAAIRSLEEVKHRIKIWQEFFTNYARVNGPVARKETT